MIRRESALLVPLFSVLDVFLLCFEYLKLLAPILVLSLIFQLD